VRKLTMSAVVPACNGSMSTQPPGNPKHAVYAAQMLKLRRTQELRLPRCLQQLANEQVVTPDRPHPPVELLTIAARPEPASSSSAVPPMCPNHRSAAVINGQQRFVTAPLELHYQPSAGGPRELLKLAVPRGEARRALLCPAGRSGPCHGGRSPAAYVTGRGPLGTADGIHGSGRRLQAGDPAIVRPVAIK
jgi:hypothetical protein